MAETQEPPRRSVHWRWLGMGVVALVLLLVLLEGALSLGHALLETYRHARPIPLAHRQTDHDAQLGWVIEDGLQDPDFYGAWHPLTTDGNGLRSTTEAIPQAGENAKAVLCIGGSQVFGVGVGDAQTWCARLGLASSTFTTVNAGQPAYGPGQAFLFYRQLDLPHTALLFTLSGNALEQMFTAEDAGFPKPWLALDAAGELRVENTPVPLRPFLWPWATANAQWLSQAYLLKPWFVESNSPELQADGLARAVVLSNVMLELRALTDAREVELVVLYLPSTSDFQGAHADLRRFISGEFDFRGIPFVDLAQAAFALPPAERSALFDATGQLSAFGHQWVAVQLSRSLPQVAGLSGLDADVGTWYARYYRDADFRQQAAEHGYPLLSLDWAGGAPAPPLPNDGFSAVFDTCLSLTEPTQARFRLVADGSASLAINRQMVVETGAGEDVLPRINVVQLLPGTHHLRVRYVDRKDTAAIRLSAQFDGGPVEPLGPKRVHAPTVSDGGLVCTGKDVGRETESGRVVGWGERSEPQQS